MSVSSIQMLMRHPFIGRVFLSNLCSQAGIWIRNMAVLLYVMDQTGGDALAVSAISVAEYAPIFLFSFIGGVFADRWRPKRTVILCDLLAAVSVGLVLIAIASGLWQAVFFTTLISAILSQFAQPAGMKLFKAHVPEDLAQPAMSAAASRLRRLHRIGTGGGYLDLSHPGRPMGRRLNECRFCAVGDRHDADSPDPSPASNQASFLPASLWEEMKDGIRYTVSRPVLLRLSFSFMAVGLGVGAISPLSIFIVTERLGLPAEDLKWITVPYGLGELLGGIAAFRLASRMAPQKLLLLGLAVNAFGIMAAGLSNVLWLTMLAQFGIALLQPAIFIGNNSLFMLHTEAGYIGRVTGLRTPLMTGAMVLMMSGSGFLKECISLPAVYLFAGACFLAGMAIVRGTPFSAKESAGCHDA
ncbi:MFS transporter [Paenibacillus sp. P25]|nr:MFS transporter [Paenibacillus sp. P25]